MADALASGASVRKDVGVQVPPRAPNKCLKVVPTTGLTLISEITAANDDDTT